MSYLASNGHEKRWQLVLMTLCFILGISTVYFILAMASSTLQSYLTAYQDIIALFGGVILVILGLLQAGIIEVPALRREYGFRDKVTIKGMGYLKAYIMGFVFSFCWTPCVGPMMANVFILASTTDVVVGWLLILFFDLGFCIPFLVIAFFYEFVLKLIREHQGLIDKLTKLAAIIVLAFGVYMIVDGTSGIITTTDSYRSLIASGAATSDDTTDDSAMMYEFSLIDQYGEVHELKDYEGKYIVLNFIASWCSYCIGEIDDYEAFAQEVDDDVAVLYVMSDVINSQSSSLTTDEFIAAYDISIPVLYDDGTMFTYLGISSFPTAVYIGPDGSYIGYQSGALDKDTMHDILDLAIARYTEGD